MTFRNAKQIKAQFDHDVQMMIRGRLAVARREEEEMTARQAPLAEKVRMLLAEPTQFATWLHTRDDGWQSSTFGDGCALALFLREFTFANLLVGSKEVSSHDPYFFGISTVPLCILPTWAREFVRLHDRRDKTITLSNYFHKVEEIPTAAYIRTKADNIAALEKVVGPMPAAEMVVAPLDASFHAAEIGEQLALAF